MRHYIRCHMTAGDQVDAVVQALSASKATIRCKDMIGYLESLGFQVRDGKKQGHKVVVHPGLAGFYSAAFTCGHGRNPEILPVYVSKMVKLIQQYESELREFLRGK